MYLLSINIGPVHEFIASASLTSSFIGISRGLPFFVFLAVTMLRRKSTWFRFIRNCSNFVGLAQQLAPDGEEIKAINLRAYRKDGERPVTLHKPRKQFRTTDYSELPAARSLDNPKETLTGFLKYASSRSKKEGSIQLLDFDTAKPVTIKVPLALMKDAVQPYFEEKVIVTATRKGKELHLDEIGPVEK